MRQTLKQKHPRRLTRVTPTHSTENGRMITKNNNNNDDKNKQTISENPHAV